MAKKGYFIPVKFFVTTFVANRYRPRPSKFEGYMEDDYRSFDNKYLNMDSSFAFVRQIDKNYDEKSVKNRFEQKLANIKRGIAYPYNAEYAKNAEMFEVDNVPKTGFKIVSVHNGAGIKVLSPDGYILNLHQDNYRYILNKCNLKGGDNFVEILDECCLGILAQGGGDTALIPKSTPFYVKASRFSESLENKISLRSVKRGNIVNTTHTEGDVKYLGGWYFSSFDQKWLITDSVDEHTTFTKQADCKIMNIRRRYVTMDKKSILTGDYQKVPESHTQVIVSKIVDNTELSNTKAEELIDKVMSAKVKIDKMSYKDKDYYRDGYRNLLEHMHVEMDNHYSKIVGHVPDVGTTLLVKKAFLKKPKIWDHKFLLEKKSDSEMSRFVNDVVNDSGFLSTDGLYLLKDKESDHWLLLSTHIRRCYMYNTTNEFSIHRINNDGEIVFHSMEEKPYGRRHDIRRRMFMVNFNPTCKQEIKKQGDDYVVIKDKKEKYSCGVFTPLNDCLKQGTSRENKFKILEPITVLSNLSQFEMYEFKVGIDNKFYSLSQSAK